ncbi:unnamed protein product [Closterium sp. NIES-53]
MAGSAGRGRFLFVFLIALVASAALRIWLELQRQPGRQHTRQEQTRELACANPSNEPINLQTSSHLDSSMSSSSSSSSSVHSRGLLAPEPPLRGPSWQLPRNLARLFPGPNGARVDPSQFRLHIKVLVYDRPDVAARCLKALANAEYDGDVVTLDIFVDHTFGNRSGKSAWTRRAADRVAVAHSLLSLLDKFTWPHGPRSVLYRSQNMGIQPQWLESWWPESVNDVAFVVEDDMEVSPLFYRYLKRLLGVYYFNASNFNPSVYGVSFQRQFFIAGFNSGLNVYDHPDPFLYQLVGTWGQFLLPAPWKQFRLWYDMRRYNSTREPSLDGLKTTVWFKNKGNRLWTPWIIKWAYAKGMFNLYPSPPGNLSLSISHREKGSNMPKNRGADAALLTPQKLAAALAAASSAASVSAGGAAGRGAAGATAGGAAGRVVAGGADVAWARSIRAWWVRPLPVLRRLERHDLCFRQLRWLPPAKSLEEFHSLLNAVAPEKYVSLIVVPFDGRDLINNWLCHIDGSGVSNLILIVPCARLAAELAARGYAVFYLPPVTRRRILRHLARSNGADSAAAGAGDGRSSGSTTGSSSSSSNGGSDEGGTSFGGIGTITSIGIDSLFWKDDPGSGSYTTAEDEEDGEGEGDSNGDGVGNSGGFSGYGGEEEEEEDEVRRKRGLEDPVEVNRRRRLSGRNHWTARHVQLVLTALSLGFNVAIGNADTIWRGDPLAADTVTRVDPSFQMWGRLNAVDFSSSFLVVRSSPSTIAAWGQLEKFCSRTPLLTNVLAGSMVVNFDVGEVECGGGGSRQQQQQAAQVLSNSVSFKEAGTIPFGPQEGVRVPKGWLLPVIVPPYAGKKEEKIASLRGARLWVIDDFDHACKAVTCRRQF